ncbi:MAG: response regulator transcription factor [Chitinophagaceae bacterium]|nr:response regulator transcription factor [Chitinophagaceae bacterium]
MERITIIIAEDNLAYAEGLRSVLQQYRKVKVIGIAQNGKILMKMLADTRPDIVLMDIQMPEMDGIEATRRMQELYPEVKVIALTILSAPKAIIYALRAGAWGYINKNSEGKGLISAIMSVHAGMRTFCPTTTNRVAHLMVNSELKLFNELIYFNEIEMQIIRLTCKEYHYKEIQQALFISSATYHRHIKAIKTKMNVRDKTGIALYSMNYGLIEDWVIGG